MSFLKQHTIRIGPFEQALLAEIEKLGGARNFHTHLDRAGTLAPKYLAGFDTNPLEAASIMSLQRKQNLVGELHRGPAYQDTSDLRARVTECIEDAVEQGVKELLTFIDATPDIELKAITALLSIKKKYADRICITIAAHQIFGFKADPTFARSRWDTFAEACSLVGAVGALPEKDDRPDSVGFTGHLRDSLNLAHDLGKPLHAHVDQTNNPRERGTLDLIEAVRWLGSPAVTPLDPRDSEAPTVWAIHALSPSSYPEEQFRQVVDGLVRYRIGVVVCPNAALSMRQDRDISVPMHNSIARVLDMALAGVHIRIGTDNLSDVFVPTYSSMLAELSALANALRFYYIPVLAKFGAGVQLNATNREAIKMHLEAARG